MTCLRVQGNMPDAGQRGHDIALMSCHRLLCWSTTVGYPLQLCRNGCMLTVVHSLGITQQQFLSDCAGGSCLLCLPPTFCYTFALQVIGVGASVIGDMSSRPNWGLNELDFVFATLVVGVAVMVAAAHQHLANLC